VSPLDQLRPPESSESRPAAAAGLDFGLSGGYAGWGPAWRLAAKAGLPPYGPLMLPGTWVIS
jgi:protease IV